MIAPFLEGQPPQPLHATEDEPEYGEQQLRPPAHFIAVVVEDRDVIVAPQLRSPVCPLQGVTVRLDSVKWPLSSENEATVCANGKIKLDA